MYNNELESFLSTNNYNYEVKGNKYVIRTDANRIDIMKNLETNLPGAKYSPTGYSSVGHVRTGKFLLLVKPINTGGSGAGAAITAIGESAQCLYCAAKWYRKGDYSSAGLTDAMKFVQVSSSLDEMLNKLPENWRNSCVASAEALHNRYGNKKYIFHRGSGLVNNIEATYTKLNKEFRKFTNINKWSPADIWMAEVGFNPNLQHEGFMELNGYLNVNANDHKLVGVSLKQTKTASVKEINFNRDRSTYQYEGFTLGKRGFYQAKDVYMMYNGGEIQFRGFPTWQGEIKGKFANHGKISGGPVREILSNYHDTAHFPTQQKAAADMKRKDSSFYSDFYEWYVTATKYSGSRPDDFKTWYTNISKKDANWQISKYFGCLLISTAHSAGVLDDITSDMINYAASQSRLSAPFIKVS